jgi:hypothetical protein
MRPRLSRHLATVLAALAIAPAPAGAIDNLGRLFFTPQQRQDLDRRRQANAQESAVTAAESRITVNGRVSRSSGKSTTWINDVPQDDTQHSRDPAQVVLPGGDGEPSVKLRVGQTLDKIRGEVKDPIEDGRIVIPATKRE